MVFDGFLGFSLWVFEGFKVFFNEVYKVFLWYF